MDYKGLKYTPPAGSTTEYYIVKSGDTLWTIAKNNGLTVDELKSLNNLTSNNLSIGQTLKVSSGTETPSASTNDTYYTVKSGDTLYAIANKYGTTVDSIKKLNNLSNNNLSIGQKLLISKGSDGTPSTSTQNTYTVKAGDTLYAIANKYGTTVDAIKEVNNLTSNTLTIGRVLIIPSSNNYTSYTVKAGDTLYGISIKYGTTVDKIKSLNNLSTNTLSIGQKLLIP